MFTGVDFDYSQNWNDLLEVEWMSGDLEMTEEEYEDTHYHRGDMGPVSGGQDFELSMCGTGYEQTVCVWH
jgi:hypothetical protein